MAAIWQRLIDERLHQWLFYDGSINSPADFLVFMKLPTNTVFLALHQHGRSPEHAMGVFWLNNWQVGSAELHFSIFRAYQGKTGIAAGRQALARLFAMLDPQNQPLLDIIVGKVPRSNRLAVRHAAACGFQQAGIIPSGCRLDFQGRRDDLTINFIKREEYPWAADPAQPTR